MRNAETVLGIIRLRRTLESRVLRKAHARFGEGRMEKCPRGNSPAAYSTRATSPGASGTRCARALGGVCADAASGQDPPDRVWPLRGGPARPARARQTGDLLLPGVHPHLRAIPPGHLPAPAEEPPRPHAGDPAEGQGRAAAAHASADPRPGALADAGGQRLLCLSCGANEPPCPHGLPPPCDRPVAAHAAAAQPKRPVHMGADGEVGRCLAPPTAPPSSLAE